MGWEAGAEHSGEAEQTPSSHCTVHEPRKHSDEHQEEENLGLHEAIQRVRDITFGTRIALTMPIPIHWPLVKLDAHRPVA